ncbi:MAG: hypothetical protein R6X21_03705 [Candidatus Aminicenantes bacterium]
METTLKTPPPPAPVITAWGPKDKVATGETLWFQGTNLNRDLFVVTFGDRAVLPHLYFEMLPTAASTSSRIVVQTTAAMKTGAQTSTPLKVLHRGGTPVILDPDYHVIDRAAQFNGTSRWHQGNTNSYGIFTEGAVKIVLNNLDFANEGTGTYREQVRLIEMIKETTEPCPSPDVLAKKTIVHYDWRSSDSQRPIRWKRDPAITRRITLYGVGARESINAVADLVNVESLQTGFVSHVVGYGPFRREYGCGASFYINPAPPSYVAYSLRRAI